LLLVSLVYSQTRLGTVYSLDSNPAGNNVIAYPRYNDGTLGTPTLYPTGGLGAGDSPAPIPVGPYDSLTTEYSVITNKAKTRLYVCNGGDNTVSAFAINVDGSLSLLTVYDSGGEQPASLSFNPTETVLYILNNGAQGRVTAQPINEAKRFNAGLGSTHSNILQTVASYPHNFTAGIQTLGSILADPSGKWVLVSEKYASVIRIFKTTRRGGFYPRNERPPIVFQNTRAWTWSMSFYTPTLLTVSALGAPPRANPVGPDSWTQTYNFDPATGQLTLLAEVDTFGGNTCWQVLGSNDWWYGIGPTRAVITGWLINKSTGAITLLNTAATTLPTGAANIDANFGGGDVWPSPDGYLYLNGQIPGDNSVQTSPAYHVFKINANDTLTRTYTTTLARPLQGSAGY